MFDFTHHLTSLRKDGILFDSPCSGEEHGAFDEDGAG